jgi:pyruvate formate lyase activating enzyme
MRRNGNTINKRKFIRTCAVLSTGALCLPGTAINSCLPEEAQAVFKKEAMFQEYTARGIMCRLCPNECILGEGDVGKCNNRQVINKKLQTLAYGNPCAANVDPIEKKPLYHFLPGTRAFSIATAGCNLECLNCQNWTISQNSPEKTRNFNLMPENVISECISKNCKSIAYTYSEPTVFYEYVYDTAILAKKAGIKNVIKSNGYINPEPLKKLCSVIDAANIDLKAFSESTYLRLSGGKLQPVLETLKIYRDMGIWLEITNLIIPKWTDNTDEIRKMCRWLADNGFSKVPVHFSRFYPTYKLEQLPPTPVDILNKAVGIAAEEGLLYIYTGNVPGNEFSDTRCQNCGNPLIIRKGYLIAENNLIAGKCNKCGTEIKGIWD